MIKVKVAVFLGIATFFLHYIVYLCVCDVCAKGYISFYVNLHFVFQKYDFSFCGLYIPFIYIFK